MDLLYQVNGKNGLEIMPGKLFSKTHIFKSLISSVNKKIQAQKSIPENLPEPKITLQYDALRTLLEALALSKGYKIYNHECYTAFLKEILDESTLGDTFDKFRKLRNAINYYGKSISSEESKEIIKEMNDFINRIKEFLQ